jgi:prefoldin alpha subunit
MPELSIQQALARLKGGEARLDALEKQISLFMGILADTEASKATLQNMPKAESKAMLPTAGGLYIPSKISGTDKILVEIGAGVAMEKELKDAVAVMDTRLEQINSNLVSLQRAAAETAGEIQVLRRKIGEYFKSHQQGQAGQE